MRQLVANVAFIAALVGLWYAPVWSESEGSLTAQLEQERKRREEIEARLNAQRNQSTSTLVDGSADQDRNGCIDAGEANQWELITGRRYAGYIPRCGGDAPEW